MIRLKICSTSNKIVGPENLMILTKISITCLEKYYPLGLGTSILIKRTCIFFSPTCSLRSFNSVSILRLARSTSCLCWLSFRNFSSNSPMVDSCLAYKNMRKINIISRQNFSFLYVPLILPNAWPFLPLQPMLPWHHRDVLPSFSSLWKTFGWSLQRQPTLLRIS